MKTKRILSAVLILAAVILSACTKDYKEEDVIKYIREELGLSSYSVISGPEEVEGEDGYTDRIWTVSTKDFDLGEELVFHVCDDRYWGLEWVTNRMTDDLEYQKQSVLMESFSVPDGFTLQEKPDSSGRPGWIMVVCGFDRRADFEKGMEFAKIYRDYAKAYPTINDTEFTLDFQVNDTGAAPDRKLIGRSYSFQFSAGTKDEEVREKLQSVSDNYLMDCIECGNLDRMDEYSTAERSAVIEADSYNTEIRRIGEETAAYPGYAYDYYYGIPYGTLYRILLEEGYEVHGDWTNYEFVGKDGAAYDCAYRAEGEVSMQVDELNAVTDLMLDDGTKMQTVVIDEELLGLLHTDAAEFAAGLEALEGDYYRSLIVEGNSVRILGKGREFSRLVRIYEARLKELDKELDDYDFSYGFVYNNLHRVYQGIALRMGSDVPREKMESIADEAVGLTALCQVLNSGEEYEWTLEVSFEKRKDGGEWETVLSYEIPRDTIDYEKVKRSY